ncbi:CU044_2847 family protein [Actinomadura fulvescens]|uniref:Trypsin-co-occurring domain-containing protein n=1 Tax=Actinomadura fulvescens TaxID=46160 RepID=A0ABP6D4U4_9ACTN
MAETEIVELELPDGGVIAVRAERVGPRGTNIGLKETLSFSAVSSALRGIAADVHQAVQAVQPDVAEVEFGLELAVKNSKLMCMLVDGEGKATLRVRLEWNGGAGQVRADGA